MRAFEEFGWSACECCDSRGVGEGGVEFGGCGTEFFGGGQRGSVYRGLTGCVCSGGLGSGGASIGLCVCHGRAGGGCDCCGLEGGCGA